MEEGPAGKRAQDSVFVHTPDQDFPESWSRDGRMLLFLRLATAGTTGSEKSAWRAPRWGGG